jgi:hypothetical protein
LSGVNTRLNLLHSDSLDPNYIEDASWDNNVNTILDKNNAMFQPLFVMRESYAADLIAVILNNGQYCGSGGGAGYFFVNQDCMVGYYSLAHEIGHIMVRKKTIWMKDSHTFEEAVFSKSCLMKRIMIGMLA